MKKIFHIILVLTFINSGLSCLSYLMMGTFLPQFQTLYDKGLMPVPEEFRALYDQLFAMPRLLYILQGVLCGVSLCGAIMMWNFRRSGWHLYTIANLLLVALPPLFLGSNNFNLGEAMYTILFIAYYYIVLRQIESHAAAEQSSQEQPIPQQPDQNDDIDDDDDDGDDD